MFYFDPSNVRQSTDTRLFPEEHAPAPVKTALNLTEILLKKQLEIVSFSDYKKTDRNLIKAAESIGSSFRYTESFLAFLRKVATRPEHEDVWSVPGSELYPVITLASMLQSIGVLSSRNYDVSTNQMHVKVNTNAISFINKTWIQLYVASVIQTELTPDDIWIDVKLKNTYNTDQFVADVIYLKDGGMYTVFCNLNPNLLNTPTNIERLLKNVSRFKRNCIVIGATEVAPVLEKSILTTETESVNDLKVITLTQLASKLR